MKPGHQLAIEPTRNKKRAPCLQSWQVVCAGTITIFGDRFWRFERFARFCLLQCKFTATSAPREDTCGLFHLVQLHYFVTRPAYQAIRRALPGRARRIATS